MAQEMSGAEIVLKALTEQGVEHVFGYPGGAVLPIYDQFIQQDKVKHILVRHEQGAAHAVAPRRFLCSFIQLFRFPAQLDGCFWGALPLIEAGCIDEILHPFLAFCLLDPRDAAGQPGDRRIRLFEEGLIEIFFRLRQAPL